MTFPGLTLLVVADFANVEFALTHSIFSVNVSLRLPGLSSGFRIKSGKRPFCWVSLIAQKWLASRLGGGTKPNKRYRDVQPNLLIKGILSNFMDAKKTERSKVIL